MADNAQGFRHFVYGVLQNATWDMLKKALGGGVLTAFGAGIYQYLLHRSVDWWGLLALGVGAGLCLFLIGTTGKTTEIVQSSTLAKQAENSTPPGIPTLSALLGQNTALDFNAKMFFALAHYSPVTAEVEKNIKIIAEQNSPNDREAFYARFIGVGLIAYLHDVTWFLIFGSQLKAIAELNSRGIIPIADLKKHYDKATVDYPKTYVDYSFEQWLDFMKARLLIATYPSQMVELSFGGKDFLKYLAHVGRNITDKVAN